jgi:hypothetical protein
MKFLTATIPAFALFILACGFLAFGTIGCKDEPKPAAPPPAPAAAPVVPMKSHTLEGVTFQYPADWKIEEAPDKKGVSVVAPAEDGNWLPNVHFTIASNSRGEDMDEWMDALLNVLRRKEGFELKRKDVLVHPAGFKYIRIDYTNTDENSGANIPLRQLSAQALLPAKKRLEIQAATAKDVWEKYQPTFDKIIASVKP